MAAILLCAIMALQDDAAVDAALQTFGKAWLKDKTPEARVALIAELAKTPHEKVVSKLGSLVTSEDKQVRLAAAAGLGTMTATPELKKSAAKSLTSALSSGANLSDVEVRIGILTALGNLGEESGEKKVREHFEDKNLKIAVAAVNAAGAMKTKGMVEPLIAVLRDCEAEIKKSAQAPPQTGQKLGQIDPNKKAPPPGSGKDPAQDKLTRANSLFLPAQRALAALSGQPFRTTDEFEKWWAANKATYAPPK